MSANKPENEIDLPELFRRMSRALGRMFQALGTFFIVSVVFLLRKWLPLGLSVIAGLGVAILVWKTTDSYYTSDLALRVNIKPTDEVITYVNRLNTFCRQNEKTLLAEAISLTEQQTSNIQDIEAFWVIDNGNDGVPDYVDYQGKHNVYDTTNTAMDDRFNIRVRINQPQELVNVRNGIIKFINSEPLFQQRNTLRLKQNTEMLARVEYDIVRLDSLQKIIYFAENKNPKISNQLVFLQEQKTQLLHDDIYRLYNKKQVLEEECAIYTDIVTVLSDFSIPSERDNGGMYYTRIFVPLFFLIALLLVILQANRKKLKEIYERY
jgi:hypothetical protein